MIENKKKASHFNCFRYFVIKVVDDDLVTFLGLGFADRGDSYDLNSKLRHHFNSVKVIDILSISFFL